MVGKMPQWKTIKLHKSKIKRKREIKIENVATTIDGRTIGKASTSRETEEKIKIEDAIAHLIYQISIYFTIKNEIGPKILRTILNNLKCSSMGKLKWYKDMFLGRVYFFKDCNERHWKEKFIDGFPNFIAERVYNSLNKMYSKCIPWDNLTYAHLTSKVIECGLDICNEIKIQSKVQKATISIKEKWKHFVLDTVSKNWNNQDLPRKESQREIIQRIIILGRTIENLNGNIFHKNPRGTTKNLLINLLSSKKKENHKEEKELKKRFIVTNVEWKGTMQIDVLI